MLSIERRKRRGRGVEREERILCKHMAYTVFQLLTRLTAVAV